MANLSKSSRETQNIKYWTEFCDHLELRGSQLHSPTPTSKETHYIYFRIGIGCVVRARQVIERKDMDPADEQDWSNQHEWIASKLERFNEVFRPRIERLAGFNK